MRVRVRCMCEGTLCVCVCVCVVINPMTSTHQARSQPLHIV